MSSDGFARGGLNWISRASSKRVVRHDMSCSLNSFAGGYGGLVI